jgi:hypothetical protein
MGDSYGSPPTDLMIRRAFESPWARRKRLNAWHQWTSQHWDHEPTTSATAEPQQETGERLSKTEAPRRALVANEGDRAAQARLLRQAAEQLDDPLLLVRAMGAEAAALEQLGDPTQAAVRYAQIVALAEDPATRSSLENPTADLAITNAKDRLLTFLEIKQPFHLGMSGSHASRRESGQVAQPPEPTGDPAQVVKPGMTVTMRFQRENQEVTFLLSDRELPDAPIDVYSPKSPLGKAVTGMMAGDTAEYELPSGLMTTIEILDVVPYVGTDSEEAERIGRTGDRSDRR